MKKVLILLIFVAFAISSFAGVRIKAKTPAEKFTIVGSLVVEYQANTEDETFSIDAFMAEQRDVVLRSLQKIAPSKISDANFGSVNASLAPGAKKRVYLVRQSKNQVYTTADALAFIAKSEGEVPTLAWALLLQEQYELPWQQQTAVLTERTVEGKNGLILVPSISPEGKVFLVSSQYPWEAHDFIFMVDEPVEDKNAEANATATANTSID